MKGEIVRDFFLRTREYVAVGAPIAAATAARDAAHFAFIENPRLKTLKHESAREFDSWSDAFQFCRDRNAPITVLVTQPCNECCSESNGQAKRIHKIYPSGRAQPLGARRMS